MHQPVGPPDLMTIMPYLTAPGLAALVLLVWAKRHGATWAQVQLSFGAAMFGAFLAASAWAFAAYLAGEHLSVPKLLVSQVLVGGACGLLVFFSTMPVERDLTDATEQASRAGELDH